MVASSAQLRKPTTKIYRPVNFQLEINLPTALHPWHDSALYICHLVYQAKAIKGLRWTDYVPLMAEYLREVVPNYKALLQALIANQVLESDENPIPGVKATGYRFAPEMRGPFRMFQPRDVSLIKRYDAARLGHEKRINWDVHKHLYAWIQRVDIDRRNALAMARRLYAATDPETYDNQLQLVEQIADGNHYFTSCEFGTRVHTRVTSLSSKLRPYLTVDGKPLVNIDVVSSQPYFLTLAVIRYWLTGSRDSRAFSSSKNQFLPSPLPSPPYAVEQAPQKIEVKVEDNMSCDDTWNEYSLRSSSIPEDMRNFARDILSGAFYEGLIEPYGKRSRRKKVDRAKIKEQVFGALYCHPKDRGAMTRVLEAKYPSVIAIVDDLKKDDYRQVSQLMQRTEAWMVLGRIVADLMTDHPDIPVVTIHDSIMTTAEHVATVEAVMRRNFRSSGLVPKLKTTSP